MISCVYININIYIYIYYVYRFPILIQHHGSPLGHQLRSSARRSLWRLRRPAAGRMLSLRWSMDWFKGKSTGNHVFFFTINNLIRVSGFNFPITSKCMIWWQIYWVKYDVLKLIIMSELLNVQTFNQIWKTVIECSNQSVIGSIIQTFIWANYNNSLTWIVRPFGDDSPY